MKNTNLITLLKIEINNIKELKKYYKNSTDLAHYELYMNDIINRINKVIILLGGKPIYEEIKK